jgi:hypothetical protein
MQHESWLSESDPNIHLSPLSVSLSLSLSLCSCCSSYQNGELKLALWYIWPIKYIQNDSVGFLGQILRGLFLHPFSWDSFLGKCCHTVRCISNWKITESLLEMPHVIASTSINCKSESLWIFCSFWAPNAFSIKCGHTELKIHPTRLPTTTEDAIILLLSHLLSFPEGPCRLWP